MEDGRGRGAPRGPHRAKVKSVLEALQTHGPLKRADLLEKARLARSTFVDRVVPTLTAEGWLEEREGGLWAIGPSGSVLAMSASRERIRSAVVDAHGEARARAEEKFNLAPINARPPDKKKVSERFIELARASLEQFGGVSPGAVAVAWPGTIRKGAKPRQIVPTASGWQKDFAFDEIFKPVTRALRLTRSPIEFVNDADAELLAETRWGVAKGENSAIGIKVCGGIGSAVVLNGFVREAEDRSIGEIGHLAVDLGDVDESRPRTAMPLVELTACSCRFASCTHLERFASGRTTIERFVRKGQDPPKWYDDEGRRLMESPTDDEDLRLVLNTAGRLVGRSLVAPWLLLEPDVVVVSPFPYGDGMLQGVKSELERISERQVDVRLGTAPDEGYWMMVRGAAAYAFDRHVRPKLDERTAQG